MMKSFTAWCTSYEGEKMNMTRECESKKEFAQLLHDNGYKVSFIALTEKYDEESEKYNARRIQKNREAKIRRDLEKQWKERDKKFAEELEKRLAAEEETTEEATQEVKTMKFKKEFLNVEVKSINKYNAIRFDADTSFYITNCTETQEPEALKKSLEKFVELLRKHGGAEILVESLEMNLKCNEYTAECTFNEIRNGGNAYEIEINRYNDTTLSIYIRICEHQDAPEEQEEETEEETTTLKNYDEVRETLIETIADLETRKNRYQTDIYLYIDENGHGTIDTFANVGGNSWLNDDHITIYTDREHYETKLDDLQNGDGRGAWNWLIDELENAYNLTGIKAKIYNLCCDDDDDEPSFKSFDDLESYDIESALYALYCDEIDNYYKDYFIPNCCMDGISERADHALDEYR